MADDIARFSVNGKEYPIPTDLTLGELCDMEQLFGVEIGPNQPRSARMVAAMLYIAIKRVDSSLTVDDIRALPPDAIEEIGGDDGPPSQQPPDEKPSASSSTAGGDSPSAGDDPVSDLNGSGLHDSGTPAISDLVT